jgi:hypothetical protein
MIICEQRQLLDLYLNKKLLRMLAIIMRHPLNTWKARKEPPDCFENGSGIRVTHTIHMGNLIILLYVMVYCQ